MNVIYNEDCITGLKEIPEKTIQTCVTSPPYFGLRDYGVDGQLGLENTPEEYVQKMVEVFREVRRVLRDDGTLWLNLGDSYVGATSEYKEGGSAPQDSPISKKTLSGLPTNKRKERNSSLYKSGLRTKQLIGIPWRVAFALQADGWYLRQDIIWHKPNPMPESVTDRCTKCHEYIFLLSKSPNYYFDNESIKENATTVVKSNKIKFGGSKYEDKYRGNEYTPNGLRNKRSVWTVTTKPYKGAHFAVFPDTLITPCILAGSKEGDIVLDPFMGSGTTAEVALRLGRQYLGFELNPEYKQLAENRLKKYQITLL